VFDPKIDPVGPLKGGSLEDLNKALHSSDQSGPGNPKCPTGWRMRADGLCCEGLSVDPTKCCSPNRLTGNGICCPIGQYAEGQECVKSPPEKVRNRFDLQTPPISGSPGKRKLPDPTRNVLPHTPLTVSLDIYFKQNQPGTIAGDDKTLRDSLTVSGAGTFDDLVTWLKKGSQFSVRLTGKASIEGPPAHNRELGEYRAYSVATALARLNLAGRIEDAPGLPAACPKLGEGIYNCGDTTASKTLTERARQVRATVFIPPGKSL
jgi:hypothetical protein